MDSLDPMPRPRHGPPSSPCVRGDRGPQVRSVQGYLRRFGYLPNPDLAREHPWWRPAVGVAPEEDDAFDESVETAVRLLQRVYGLAETGEVDAATVRLMSRPRCGFPDVVTRAGLAPYVAQGNRWPGPEVTYRHLNFTPDLSPQEVRDAVRGAYHRWAVHVPLTFVEAAGAADMEIGFFAGEHGDGAENAFDGPGGVLAHCYYPPPNSGSAAGDCHFDEAETWSVDTPASGTDLPSVALHELGHGLGLAHSEVADAVMYAYYDGARRELHPDDVAGIQSVYGPRPAPQRLTGVALVEVDAATRPDGRVEVVGQGTDGALWHVAVGDGDGLGEWESLGGWLAHPVAVSAGDGRLEVFGRGSDGALWRVGQSGPGAAWGGWTSLGGVVSRPAVASYEDGRLEVFTQGRDGALWHVEESEPGGEWGRWRSLGGWVAAPVVARDAEGRLEVFVRGADDAVWHVRRTEPGGGWGGWASLGGRVRDVAVARNADGRLEVFARGSDDALWHVWQTVAGGVWSAWATLGGRVREVAVAPNADGRLEVFVRGADDALWHVAQTEANGDWGGWGRLAEGAAGRPVPVSNGDGRLEVVARGGSGGTLRVRQVSPGGAWS